MPESGESQGSIALEQLGLGSVLKQFQLSVPVNQREYSWEEEHVEQMFDDLAEAVQNGEEHFFGTIVTIPRHGILEVVDGQQRLATTAVLLAAIRNYLGTIGELVLVESLNNEFLTGIDRTERLRVPKLSLNADDNELFKQIVVGDALKPSERLASHARLSSALTIARRRVASVISVQSAVHQHGDLLERWLTFLEAKAVVILLRVPDDGNAYKMFETLNDRGLRTSQVDLIKNYLFSKSVSRMAEMQTHWSYMRGSLEGHDEDDIVINFLRHALIAQEGHVTAAKVYDKVRAMARNQTSALSFVTNLEQLAAKYVAILSPEHDEWKGYPSEIARALEALTLFNIKPLRPLLLAIAYRMTQTETTKSYEFLVSLGVRLMVASSTRSGSVEQPLATAARKVWTKELTTKRQLRDELIDITPTDSDFSEAFTSLKVSNQKLARYYLRRLQDTDEPPLAEYALQEDTESVNLEHVLPKRPDDSWSQYEADDVQRLATRVGNLALMKKKDNSDAKSASFADKKPLYAISPYTLTKILAEFDTWDETAIKARQVRLAALAPKAWPVK